LGLPGVDGPRAKSLFPWIGATGVCLPEAVVGESCFLTCESEWAEGKVALSLDRGDRRLFARGCGW